MSWLVLGELLLALVIFPVLFFVPAPYGRHLREGFGPTMPARAGWMVMEAPAVVVPVMAFVQAGGGIESDGIWLLALWELHYLQRTLIFPLRMRAAGRKPVLTVGLAFAFNVMNGIINGAALAAWRADLLALAGAAVFLAGMAINWHSDAVLRRLRAPNARGQDPATRYRIPRGGLFRSVSAANYFGEIVEWLGFALAARTPAAAAFALFTTANLVPRGVTHHRWYREHFPDYPRERRAVVPFLL
jgi:3-oxo-5-alpha-steroid 4-dehydrogenase 1